MPRNAASAAAVSAPPRGCGSRRAGRGRRRARAARRRAALLLRRRVPAHAVEARLADRDGLRVREELAQLVEALGLGGRRAGADRCRAPRRRPGARSAIASAARHESIPVPIVTIRVTPAATARSTSASAAPRTRRGARASRSRRRGLSIARELLRRRPRSGSSFAKSGSARAAAGRAGASARLPAADPARSRR